MNIPYVFKRCSKCGEWKVASTVNFGKAKRNKYRLNSYCKKCQAEYYKQYSEDNKDKIKQYREAHKEERKQYDKQRYEDNKDKILEQNKQYRETHKEEIKERKKKYNETHKEQILEYKRKNYYRYREKYREYDRQYSRQYRREHPEADLNNKIKRRSKIEQQGNGITKEQWLEMMEYFNWCDAYSGEYIGGSNNKRTVDHIVALNKGGEHTIWNLVPMSRSNNSSKQDKDMIEWYKIQDFYSEERLKKIQDWIKYSKDKYK